MPKRVMSDDQWISALKECRSSGLTDKEWCVVNGISLSTLYRAIRRLRKKDSEIPSHSHKIVPIKQEVVEVASVDENGNITRPEQVESVSASYKAQQLMSFDSKYGSPVFEATAQILMPSGMKIELSNNTDAATIRNILSVLQTV